MPYDKRNFHKHTFCVWQRRETSDLPDRKPDFRSRSGSVYHFTDEGVFRHSDHWARVANCKWRLDGPKANGFQLGFAKWTDFHPDNDHDKLYYIAVDFQTGEARYVHRDAAPSGNALLRTAAATARRIREIRKILTSDQWADYLEGDVETMRRSVVDQLVGTDETFAEIRRAFLPGR